MERFFVSQLHVGRHRSSGYSAMGEIATIAARTARPAVKASALVVASGGLVAAYAVPATAAPATSPAAAAAPAVAQSAAAPLAVPAAFADSAAATPLVSAHEAFVASVVAPSVAADVTAVGDLGVLGFTAAKAAAPVTVKTHTRTTTTVVSRSATRSTVRSTATVKPKAAKPTNISIPGPTSGIIAIAASLTGIPYVYGGTSTNGFDCSGFTQFVYRRAGISIPRTAESQRQAATKVTNPAPGDLIFFGFPAYHVGIYAGPGKLYHASRPGTLTSLASIWTYSNVSYGRF